jgi:hypothetical protein
LRWTKLTPTACSSSIRVIRPAVLRSADADVQVFGRRPPSRLGVALQLEQLVVGGLLGRADSRIQCDSHGLLLATWNGHDGDPCLEDSPLGLALMLHVANGPLRRAADPLCLHLHLALACQLTPDNRPLVFAHWGPLVFTRKGATRFRAIGGHPFSPDRGPGVDARSGATPPCLPFSTEPSTAASSIQREAATWREGERTCWKFES